MKRFFVATAALAAFSAFAAPPQDTPAGEQRFRELYKKLVETNTSLSVGSCTLAADRMAARLKAAGFPDSDLHPFAAPDHPKEGGLVAVFPGKDPKRKAILLLAHIDVVEAKREDWTRDPFKLVEENGYFYARGSVDDKAEAAIWVDTFIRFKSEKYQPRRTLKLALTCGEETAGAFNGADWLTRNRRDLIDAAFALNEGAAGELDVSGHRVALEVEAGEKFPQNYRLEGTNKGGHSSRPMKDNAIYRLAAALTRISDYEFPAQFTDGNRAYFTGMAKILAAKGDTETANAMNAFLKNPNDAQALALVSAKDPSWNATLRTTCVATMMDAGHATNALPQRARANVNCRIFPGVGIEEVRAALTRVLADGQISVTTVDPSDPVVLPPPLTPAILKPIEQVTHRMYPGIEVVPVLQAAGTDAIYLAESGIPTYGISGMFIDPDLSNVHGLNERIRVQSLYDGRDFLFSLVKLYAERVR